MESHKLSLSKSKDFLFGGKSTFTVVSKKTQHRITFRVKELKDKNIYFVSYLFGSDNTQSFKFIGTIFDKNGKYNASRKNGSDPNSNINKSFEWVYNTIVNQNVSNFDKIEFWHEGKCGKCGRKLTVPSSIETGFGPYCEKNI